VEDVVSGSTALAGAYRGKRVFVTGNTGFKGSWLALWLVRMGADVTGFSDAVPTDPSHFDRLGLDYPSIYGDIADEAAVRSAVAEARPDIVFHMAAQSLVRRSYSDPVETYRTNVVGTLALFEACRAAGVGAVVSATTDKVYRNREWDWGYREADELGGSDPYSASKSCVELMTRSYRESFLRDGAMLVASVRAGNVVAALKAHVPALEVEHVPETAGRHESGLLELDSTRAVSRLGWRPLWEDEMLERTVEWYRAFYEEGRLLSDDQLSAYCATLDRAG
jgi:CDP-glucose 4,6-dehydratase